MLMKTMFLSWLMNYNGLLLSLVFKKVAMKNIEFYIGDLHKRIEFNLYENFRTLVDLMNNNEEPYGQYVKNCVDSVVETVYEVVIEIISFGGWKRVC